MFKGIAITILVMAAMVTMCLTSRLSSAADIVYTIGLGLYRNASAYINALQTQFIWLGTKQQRAKLDYGALTAEFLLMVFSTTVRDLVVFWTWICLCPPHRFGQSLQFLSASQLRAASRSLTFNATLIHAFVPNRLDLCPFMSSGVPRVRIDWLELVHRATARLIGGFAKTDRVSHYCARASELASRSPAHLFPDLFLGLEVPARALLPRLVLWRSPPSSLSRSR